MFMIRILFKVQRFQSFGGFCSSNPPFQVNQIYSFDYLFSPMCSNQGKVPINEVCFVTRHGPVQCTRTVYCTQTVGWCKFMSLKCKRNFK